MATEDADIEAARRAFKSGAAIVMRALSRGRVNVRAPGLDVVCNVNLARRWAEEARKAGHVALAMHAEYVIAKAQARSAR